MLLDTYLQDVRKQIGSGMASVEVRTDRGSTAAAVIRSIEKEPVDLVIVGWRPVEGADIAEQILRVGNHHLLLAAHPGARLEKALVCVASGEPGKDDVMFAGRLLRHLGAHATLLTILDGAMKNEYQARQVERFMAGGVHSLEMFGVPTQSELKIGNPQTDIVEEIKKGEFDLVVLGAPLPQKDGRIIINRVIENVMKNAGNCSLLIVRSHYHKNIISYGYPEYFPSNY
jgi:sulfate transport system ATP-binding protein